MILQPDYEGIAKRNPQSEIIHLIDYVRQLEVAYEKGRRAVLSSRFVETEVKDAFPDLVKHP